MNRTILVAVADEVLRERVAWCLLARLYRVRTVSNAFDALDVASSTDVDMVLFDIDLPLFDGRTLLHHMAEHPELRYVPVLVLLSEGGTAPNGLPVLRKRFDEDNLLRAVTSIVGSGPHRQVGSGAPAAGEKHGHSDDPAG
jgi:CheY-like chemotaxis protein